MAIRSSSGKLKFAAALYLVALCVSAQTLEEQIFGAANRAKLNAESAGAELLSPRNYSRGQDEYERARRDFEKSRNLERIKDRLSSAQEFFATAKDNSEVAKLTLADTIGAREAAAAADAQRLAEREWRQAEKEFSDAIRSLEKGDLTGAQQEGEVADGSYRTAELIAIKGRYLFEARRLSTEAENMKVDRYAPRTLSKAREHLQAADKALTVNRYETERPTALAAEAVYEFRHSMFIADLVRNVDDEEISIEDVVLGWEASIRQIATAAEVETDLSTGQDATTTEIVAAVNELQQLKVELKERDREVAGLEDEIRELDEQLGGASAERTALVRRLEAQARIREQFEQLEGLFGPEEAVVLRDASGIIVRLIGLGFASGSSNLGAESSSLMDKVRRAAGVFPGADFVVEGHTDSSGSESLNLRLSQARAESVMNYMIENMRIPTYKIKAVGYGDSNPVASNRTESGRALNRRIDVVIIPQNDAGSN